MATEAEPVPVETPEETPSKFELVGKVYEGAKSLYATTKSFPLLTPLLDAGEGVSVQMLMMTFGIENLLALDDSLKPFLTGLDSDLLDPAIAQALGLVETAQVKSGEMLTGAQTKAGEIFTGAQTMGGEVLTGVQTKGVEAFTFVQVKGDETFKFATGFLEGLQKPKEEPEAPVKESEEVAAPETSAPVAA